MMRIKLGIMDQPTNRLTDGGTDRWVYRRRDDYNHVDRGGIEMENAMAMIGM